MMDISLLKVDTDSMSILPVYFDCDNERLVVPIKFLVTSNSTEGVTPENLHVKNKTKLDSCKRTGGKTLTRMVIFGRRSAFHLFVWCGNWREG